MMTLQFSLQVQGHFVNQGFTKAVTPNRLTCQQQKDPLDTDHLKVGLGARSIRGTLILLLSQVGKFALQLVSLIVMAHLVSPDDFGLFSIVFAIIAFGLLFKESLALGTVQREELNHSESSALFWINLGIGLTLAVLTSMTAPFVARFYRQPLITPLLITMCSMFIFTYLGIQHLAVLRRQMRFGVLAVIDQISMFMSIGIGIFCAWRGCGVWSLAAVQIGLSAFTCAGAWLASRWRPGRFVANSGLRKLLLYGKHIAAADVITYFARNLDNLLIGWCCGMTSLGFYDRAYSLMIVPTQQLLGPVSGVAITSLCRLQKETERFCAYAKNTISICSGLGMPACAFLCIGAHRLIPCLLGDNWRGAVPTLQALAPGAFIDSFIMGIGAVMLASGNTRQYFQFRAYAAILAVVGFFLGVHWGPTGVAIALSVSRLLVAVIAVRLCSTDSAVKWAQMRQSASPPFLAAIAASLIVTGCGSVIDAAGDAKVSLLISAVLFSLLYLAIWTLQPGGARSIAELAALLLKRNKPANTTANGDASNEQEPDLPDKLAVTS
jgi:O-antigen/teichoic acid export membrane protein